MTDDETLVAELREAGKDAAAEKYVIEWDAAKTADMLHRAADVAEQERDELREEREAALQAELDRQGDDPTERALQLNLEALAAVIAEALAGLNAASIPLGMSEVEWMRQREWETRRILSAVPSDVLRERDERVFAEGWIERASRDISFVRGRTAAGPPDHLNPYCQIEGNKD